MLLSLYFFIKPKWNKKHLTFKKNKIGSPATLFSPKLGTTQSSYQATYLNFASLRVAYDPLPYRGGTEDIRT